MRLSTKNILTFTRTLFTAARFIVLVFFIFAANLNAQNNEVFTLTADALQDGKSVELNKLTWKYHAGDDAAWANPQFDDSSWDKLEETVIKPEAIPKSGWNGRAWFRLYVQIDESLADKNFAFIMVQRGASEIYLDGKKLVTFGAVTDTEISEYNPSRLPIPFRFEGAGEHLIAVRFASETLADMSVGIASWLANGGIYPSFSLAIRNADDLNGIISQYAFTSSMRVGFLFIGFLLALALLHFLLYIFYRVERGNLFYSIYAFSFAILLVCGNLMVHGHQPILPSIIAGMINSTMLAVEFVALLAFVHVVFARPLGKLFWILTAAWAVSSVLNCIFLNKTSNFRILTNVLIGLSFTFCILILVKALREKRPGAWILMVGVQLLSFGMFSILLNQFGVLDLPENFLIFGQFALILAVPIAVSVFLARNFARTNRDLKTQLAQVEELSLQKIEQERQSAELRAENERRAKELEGARALQLSMLPNKLPQIPYLEIAAYMKPATEVGGDYYDFHVGDDGTLTVAVGDATGHGLKAGTVVTATKGLFNNLAPAPDIPDTFKQISRSLKLMNLRGLFMAMTMLKIKDNRFSISAAGMPSTLIYRHATGEIEEINLRAVPLGSFAAIEYKKQEYTLSNNDCVVLMSDGFTEMFNESGEMLGDGEANKTLKESAQLSPQEIINRFVKVGEDWAGKRPPDDDVTFVVLKVKSNNAF
ncbi:MAG: SpoIIE family protein phosphatase [Acidobacteria bacterium]|nr:SpoIIE family protein phosphatase [Acidobacteriota bacterium]